MRVQRGPLTLLKTNPDKLNTYRNVLSESFTTATALTIKIFARFITSLH